MVGEQVLRSNVLRRAQGLSTLGQAISEVTLHIRSASGDIDIGGSHFASIPLNRQDQLLPLWLHDYLDPEVFY